MNICTFFLGFTCAWFVTGTGVFWHEILWGAGFMLVAIAENQWNVPRKTPPRSA